MPKGSKKRKAIKRKEAANHHQSSTTSSSTHQGNGAGGDQDNSDHQLTDEEFSPRAAMEAPPDPEPDNDGVPEPVPVVSEEASVVLGKLASVVPEPELYPEPAVNKDMLVIPIEQQNVLEPEQIEAISTVTTEFLNESAQFYKVEDEIGEEKLYHERIEPSKPMSAASEEKLGNHVEQQNVSEPDKTEAAMSMETNILEEPSATSLVEKKSVELSLYDEHNKVPAAIPSDAPNVGYSHVIEHRASWWNCCGFLDFFRGDRR